MRGLLVDLLKHSIRLFCLYLTVELSFVAECFEQQAQLGHVPRVTLGQLWVSPRDPLSTRQSHVEGVGWIPE